MIGISDDYASIDIDGVTFYYGYEFTDREVKIIDGEEWVRKDKEYDDGEWMFVVYNENIDTEGILWSATTSEIEARLDKYDAEALDAPVDYLLTGIALFFQDCQDFDLCGWSEMRHDLISDEPEEARPYKSC